MTDQHTKNTEALADAMWQLLDDMGKRGQSVCGHAKADARIAMEPFLNEDRAEYEDWMTMEEARQIIREVEEN